MLTKILPSKQIFFHHSHNSIYTFEENFKEQIRFTSDVYFFVFFAHYFFITRDFVSSENIYGKKITRKLLNGCIQNVCVFVCQPPVT